MDGIEATRRLRGDPVRVLIPTTFGQDDHVYDALRAGASGFLLKDVRRAELVHAVRVVAAGESLLAPAVTTRLIETAVRRQAPSVNPFTGLDRLTPRERETLRLLDRGLTNAEVAAAYESGLVVAGGSPPSVE